MVDKSILDAVGEVIASQMKADSLSYYRRERDGEINRDDPRYRGTYEGCLSEAESFVDRLKKRGFIVVGDPGEPFPCPKCGCERHILPACAQDGCPMCNLDGTAMDEHDCGVISSGNIFADIGCEDPEFLMVLADVRIAYDDAQRVMAAEESMPLAMTAKDMEALLDGPFDDGGSLTWAKVRTKVSMAVMQELYQDLIQRGEKTNADFDRLIADLSSRDTLKRYDGKS